jgi:hypothetical protein
MQFTTMRNKNKAIKELQKLLKDSKRPDVDEKEQWSIDWRSEGCERGAEWGANSCPHLNKWFYTVNDAFSALACQVSGVGIGRWRGHVATNVHDAVAGTCDHSV